MNNKNSQAGPPPCDQIVLASVNSRREQLEGMFELMLQRVDEAFEAKRLVEQRTGRDGTTLLQIVGPDHDVRLAAVKLFVQIMTVGRPLPKAPSWVRTEPTIEDLKRRWAEWVENND
jgi:hypothetical protein